VFRIIDNSFYFGKFEFPQGSGIWYDGAHDPIITKELFELARSSIKSQVIKSYGKEFAFTRMIKCGVCGSGITADEKFKNLKGGGVNRYVYYRCCKSQNRDCNNPAINEDDLIVAFQNMADKLELNKVELNEKMNIEIQRFKKLQAMFLGKKKSEKIEPVDLRDYAKFVLSEGSILEKRAVLGSIQNEIILKNKTIEITT